MEAKHTATPWTVEDIGANVLLIKSRAVPVNESASSTERDYYSRIASVTQREPHPRHNGGISMTNCKANAEFIVRAVNAHDDLVKVAQSIVASKDMIVCRETHATLEECAPSLIADAVAAIAKAGAA